jgi:hypothetical protein
MVHVIKAIAKQSGGHCRSRSKQSHPSDKVETGGGCCPFTFPELIALSVVMVLVVLFLPVLFGFCALPDFSERAPVTEHPCVILSTNIKEGRMYIKKNGKRVSSSSTGYFPAVQVRLVVSNATHWAMRYRHKSSPLNGQGYSKFEQKCEAEAFLGKFPVGESVTCYRFEDGTVKLEEDPPELMVGTHMFYVLSSLAFGMVCFVAFSATARCCCGAQTTDKDSTSKKNNIEASAADLEAGHADTASTVSTVASTSDLDTIMSTEVGLPQVKTEV